MPARAALEHGRTACGERTFVALIEPVNEPSQRVADRLGMRPERDLAYPGKAAPALPRRRVRRAPRLRPERGRQRELGQRRADVVRHAGVAQRPDDAVAMAGHRAKRRANRLTVHDELLTVDVDDPVVGDAPAAYRRASKPRSRLRLVWATSTTSEAVWGWPVR